MISILWPVMALLDITVSLLAFPLAPYIVIATDSAGKSPRWCWPWLTPDNPIDGDAGHILRWPDNGTRWRVFCRRVAWLWRNRGYNFSTYVTGWQISGETHYWGDRAVSDNPVHAGWCLAYNSGAWEIYAFVPWWSSAKRGLRVRLGWAIPLTIGNYTGRVMLKTHINPVKGYA